MTSQPASTILQQPSSTHATRLQHACNRVITFIEQSPEGDLSLDALAEVACLSKFHFHRVFNHLIGCTVHDYVKSVRLHRAAHQLAFRQTTSVTDIAFTAGYTSSEAFSRAFKHHCGFSPNGFRTDPQWHVFESVEQRFNKTRNNEMANDDYQVEWVEYPATDIALLVHTGPVQQLRASIGKFISWRKQHRVAPARFKTFNILYDDPNTTAPEQFRFGLASEFIGHVPVNDAGVHNASIPAVTCARIRHIGDDDQLTHVVSYLYRQWLPEQDAEPADFPLFYERVAFYPDVPASQAITDVYLPVICQNNAP